jgi:integrase
MPVEKLTAKFVREAKCNPGDERTIFWDEARPGFGLMVTPSGHKSWIVQYRAKRTSRRYTIGSVAKLDIEQAVRRARAVQGKVAEGADPVLEKRREAESDRNAMKAVAERYLAREGGKLRTTAKRQATLERLVYPKLGAQQIGEIKRSDINHLLDDIEDQRGRAMADQVLALLRRIFNWHAARSDEFRSPIVRGMARRKPEERERNRVLSDDELRRVWIAANDFPAPWGAFIRLLLLTAARRTEVGGMKRSEITGNEWTIPRERYKTGAEVTLPLSTAAMNVLAGLPRIGDCDYIFTTDGRRPISGFSTFKLKFDIACGVKGWRLHDLRRTARSLMSRAGVPSDHAERCLGHALPGIRGTYDRHRYLEEMKQAFEALAPQIARIVDPQNNVVAMRGVS